MATIPPPKPRSPLKSATTPKDDTMMTQTEQDDARAMPPPPDPRPAPGILEQEFDGLSGCLKNTALKVGQIYGFYADSRKL